MTITEWRKKNPEKNKESREREKVARKSCAERNRKYRKYRNEWTTRTNRAIIRDAKDMPCQDCGVKYPHYVMEFDHTGDKKSNISELASRKASQKQLWEEISKCDVVCANCHKVRTWIGGGGKQ